MEMECGTYLNVHPFFLRKGAKFVHQDSFGHYEVVGEGMN